MTANEEWNTPALPPNLRWLFKHHGETVELSFGHTSYVVTVEREREVDTDNDD